MVDIHHHLLPGLDDGSPDLATSIDMARMAAQDGITHIVCTPHANDRYVYDPFRVEDLITTLRSRLIEERIELRLVRGADFHLTYDNIREAIADPARFSIAGRGYLMTELPDYGSFTNFNETFYQLQVANLTPVLTHPERNATLQGDRSRLEDWMRQGVLMQVTAGSVLGHMGRKAQKMAYDLLEKRWVHFIATDAHNLTSRPPKLRAAYEEVARRTSTSYADLLFVTNPLCAFEGRTLPSQPEPRGLFDEEPEESEAGWWKRLFSR